MGDILKADFVSVNCFNFGALNRFTEVSVSKSKKEPEKFMEALVRLTGLEPTLPAVRGNSALLSLIHMGVIIEGFNENIITSIRILKLPKDTAYWYGSVLEWRDTVAAVLSRKDSSKDAKVLFTGIAEFIQRNIFEHTFYKYRMRYDKDNIYIMEEK